MFNIRPHSLFAVTALFTAISCAPVTVRAQSIQASPADAFVDTIGTNVHLHWAGTLYYDNFPLVEQRLQQLGIRHLRDGLVDTGWQGYYDHFNQLGQLGIKTTFITSPGQNPALLSAYPGRMSSAFEAFEGPNEYNSSGDPNWVSTLRTFQQTLFNTVKGNTATAGFPVIGPSLTSQAAYAALGNVSGFFDQGNMHDYLGGQHPGSAGYGPDGNGSILWNLLLTYNFCQPKPVITTETGYYTAPAIQNGVPIVVAGRYMPRLFLEQFNHGVGRTILYELVDQNQNLSNLESNYGLLYYDGSPKPAFNAVASLVQILKDPGPSFKPATLNMAMSGNTPAMHSSLFQKRDGSFYLVLWVELPSYDLNTRQMLTVNPQLVTLTFNQPVGAATVYSFDDNGVIASGAGHMVGNTLAVSVSDRISIVALAPAATTIPVTVATSPSGQTVTIDGASVVAPQTFNWQPASTHTIGASTVVTGTGQRLSFGTWSDGGAASHQIAVPSAGSATYTANFNAAYALSASVTGASGGTIGVTPSSPDTYYVAGAQVQVSATAASGFRFTGFNGALSGTASPQSVTMSSPKSVAAGFACLYSLPTSSLTVSSNGGSGNLSISSGAGCAWSAVSSASWLQVTTASGSGTAPVAFSVQQNTSTSSRTAMITVSGQIASITQSGAPAATLPALPTIRVNAGGSQYTDTSGKTWSSDYGFSGGATAGTMAAIKNTNTQVLYQTERYGPGAMSYTFAVPNGTYAVRLKFVEFYFSKPGQRVFNVVVNGQTVLQNFDLVAIAGPLTAYDKQVAVAVNNGTITIQFQHVVENPKISAIEIVPGS